MMKSKAITAGAIALTLTLGGGSLWASQFANAATAADTQSTQAAQAEDSTSKKVFAGKRGGLGHGFNQIQDELLAYLGLDEVALQTKLKTLTLAEIAVEQGKTREELKTKLVEWLEVAQAEAGANADVDAAAKAEKLLDSKGFGFGKHGGRGGHGWGGNIDAIAEILGLTADELKAEIKEGKTIAAIATEKGVDVQKVIDAQVSEIKEKLNEQLAAGEITQEQYDTKLAASVERATNHVNGVLPEGGKGWGDSIDAIAEALGLTADELKAEIEEGKTIAAIATEKGVDVQTVVDAWVSEIKEKLNEQLAAGEITQEQYDTKLAAAVEHATKHVNGELPMSGMGGKGPRGERGGAASGDQPAADTTTSATTA
ncbi:SHOCT domain-containing protein [Paenibacillus prosopidis]|uniref:Putative oligomerization/nucleic acid binding protein n=1 Tax=Paenibacillus prosopidis TaxID=630520 RepID=A0A368VUY8_9BACL|nr:SHOCT domain-containing protein [Paenibacillus prosopidis]RCW44948.1 putative oligomerization/nucleic acid binding protein [Paenibacillus prosopidis]